MTGAYKLSSLFGASFRFDAYPAPSPDLTPPAQVTVLAWQQHMLAGKTVACPQHPSTGVGDSKFGDRHRITVAHIREVRYRHRTSVAFLSAIGDQPYEIVLCPPDLHIKDV